MDDLNIPNMDTPDDTDPFVRQWSQGKSLNRDELQHLSTAICRQARIEAADEKPQPARRSRSAIVAAAVAAALSIAAVYLLMFRPNAVSNTNNNDAEFAQATAIPAERLRLLASESGRLFDQRVAWLAELNQNLLMGLDEEAHAADQKRQQIALRVVVFHRNSRSQAWQPVFSTNVVTREEEVIEMQNPADGQSLRLWTHILPDQSVAVDTDLAMSGQAGPHWSTTSVLSGGPAVVFKQNDGPGEYQVWQSAAITSAADPKNNADKGL
ncbi:hypothetical protein [Anatilimnocola floriformis]|uniref:hypothetical protein n=1 Tax=Anatilimnocola floriformis TaxID=2948575 RepID=UPI0020C1D1FD|nr:hypothetical protein [Anatilimnocola floriformis]